MDLHLGPEQCSWFGLLTVNGLRFQYGDTVRTIVPRRG